MPPRQKLRVHEAIMRSFLFSVIAVLFAALHGKQLSFWKRSTHD
jgi:hypothetical protein